MEAFDAALAVPLRLSNSLLSSRDLRSRSNAAALMQPSFVSNLKARASAGGRATGSGGGPPKFNEWIAAEASSYERAEELLAAAADALLADSKAHSMLVLPTMTPAAAPEDVAGPADAAAAVPELPTPSVVEFFADSDLERALTTVSDTVMEENRRRWFFSRRIREGRPRERTPEKTASRPVVSEFTAICITSDQITAAGRVSADDVSFAAFQPIRSPAGAGCVSADDVSVAILKQFTAGFCLTAFEHDRLGEEGDRGRVLVPLFRRPRLQETRRRRRHMTAPPCSGAYSLSQQCNARIYAHAP